MWRTHIKSTNMTSYGPPIIYNPENKPVNGSLHRKSCHASEGLHVFPAVGSGCMISNKKISAQLTRTMRYRYMNDSCVSTQKSFKSPDSMKRSPGNQSIIDSLSII